MRKIVIICFLCGLMMSLHAQLQDTVSAHYQETISGLLKRPELPINNTIEDAFAVDEYGNLVAVRNSDEYELATFLNTTIPIVHQILEQQGYLIEDSVRIRLYTGDSIKINYSRDFCLDTLSCIGRMIRNHIHNPLGKFLFTNYWLGGDDCELSALQFAEILLCIKQNQDILLHRHDSLSSENGFVPCNVSFYGTDYGMAFGNATIYLDSDCRFVGLYDVYDFDKKHWGMRPLKQEFFVRLVSMLSPSVASGYRIRYGNVP